MILFTFSLACFLFIDFSVIVILGLYELSAYCLVHHFLVVFLVHFLISARAFSAATSLFALSFHFLNLSLAIDVCGSHPGLSSSN
jgi:hypothetical protein